MDSRVSGATWLAGCLSIGLLSGCSLLVPSPKPEPLAYMLAITPNLPSSGSDGLSLTSAVPPNPAVFKARISLEPEGSSPSGDSTSIFFIGSNGTLGSYQFAEWAEPPSTVFHRMLYEQLAREGRLTDISFMPGLIAANRLVRFRLDKFWLDTSVASIPQARAELSTVIIDLETRRTIGRQVFSESVPVPEPSAESTVMALSEAGRKILHRWISWLYDTLAAHE